MLDGLLEWPQAAGQRRRRRALRPPETASAVGLGYCARLDPEALLDSLKAGRYYSTQGPSFRELLVDGERLRVETSEAYAISLTGAGDRWQSGQERHGTLASRSRRRSSTSRRFAALTAASPW